MFIKKQLFSLIFGGLLFTGLTLTVYLSLTTNTATAATEASGTAGPLTLTIRMGKPAYLTGEMVIVHATLTNMGNASIPVFKPQPPYSLFYLLDGKDIVREFFSTASMAGPTPLHVVRLAPNISVSISFTLSMRDSVSPIGEGRHTLAGRYNTTKIPLEGIWTGEITTAQLTFTVSAPTGAEANAYQLYQKLLNLHRSGFYPDNFAQTEAIAADMMSRFPNSVYVPCALWKVVPQLRIMKQHDDIVDLTEVYFALKRSDDPYLTKSIARFCAEAYHAKGNPRKALSVLDTYAPGEDSVIRKQIEAALQGKS